ncbi:uncharacterized protein F5891DRAFT_1280398 [Suillus fuscotomentosus]|uniref:DUF4604 domain-containing protein n=1 Tax=Suillus fuscotomentosus TaxID=1912939 RepID=A0AAD4HGM1_9AGAM|nr:uncharacterized protein F5891DRAFT_1280398 [Suillus fuscotomentosus]KAG1896910.1 hypothetical protein F5891DRAFT_1280398 [Suillus fuscotomentosus]
MSAKEPTRQQLSSRLQYQSHVPAFLQKFQNKIQGITDEDEDEPQYYDDGSGRPPIPVRAAIPQRPDDDPGSADEDDVDERPQVVVLKEGKHLTEREAENERRKEKGLPPLPDPNKKVENDTKDDAKSEMNSSKKKQKEAAVTLSFSSSGAKVQQSNKLKRKVVGDLDGSDEGSMKASKKKSKKTRKGPLSFGEDV